MGDFGAPSLRLVLMLGNRADADVTETSSTVSSTVSCMSGIFDIDILPPSPVCTLRAVARCAICCSLHSPSLSLGDAREQHPASTLPGQRDVSRLHTGIDNRPGKDKVDNHQRKRSRVRSRGLSRVLTATDR